MVPDVLFHSILACFRLLCTCLLVEVLHANVQLNSTPSYPLIPLPPEQHPHEEKQRLATVPLLELCLAGCSVAKGRKFKLGQFPELDLCGPSTSPRDASNNPDDLQRPPLAEGNGVFDSISDKCDENWNENTRSHATCLMLFPSREAVDIRSWGMASEGWLQDSRDSCYLVVVDGSWQHAQEMVKSSRAYLDPRVTFVRRTKYTPSDIYVAHLVS